MKKLLIISFMLMAMLPQVFADEVVSPFDEVTEQVVDPSFSIYPNPVTGEKFRLEFKGMNLNANSTVTISNLIGQVLYTAPIAKQDISNGSLSLDLSDYNIGKGIYFIKVVNGDKSIIKKLVLK